MDLLSVIKFAAGLVMLILGADIFTDHAVEAARRLRVAPFLLALLIAGAEPEEFIAAAIASGKGMGALAVGNALGTNICIIGFALALAAIIFPIKIDRSSRRHSFIALGISVLILPLLINLELARWEGILLAVLFIVYVWYAVTKERLDIETEDVNTEESIVESLTENNGKFESIGVSWHESGNVQSSEKKEGTLKPVLFVLGGTAVMGLGGDLLVGGAEGIMGLLNLSEAVVGLTFVSFATSLEMIALSLVPLYKGHPEISLGGIIGSYINNILLTLGIAAIVQPLVFDIKMLTVDFSVMVGMLCLTMLAATRDTLGRLYGIAMFLVYIAYLYYLLGLR